MQVVLLGCGPSSAVPCIRCVIKSSQTKCAVCLEAHDNPLSKNHRGNPSLLVRFNDMEVLIDCGKTFRSSVLRFFPQLKVQKIDAVLLTHGHADACLGMDDLREVQHWLVSTDAKTGEEIKINAEPLFVHGSQQTRAEIAQRFSYLIADELEEQQQETNPNAETYRWTAQLGWKIFQPLTQVDIKGLKFFTLPLIHGEGYISYGFEFGAEYGIRFVYLSDVSRIPPETEAVLLDTSKGVIDVLILDALFTVKKHGTHMNLSQALDTIRILKPKKTILTGMSHDFDYGSTNVDLIKLKDSENLDVQMGFDGLIFDFGY